MSVQEVELLVVSPQLPPVLISELETRFRVHKGWEIVDRERWLAENAPRIQAVATNAPVGIDAGLIARLPALKIISSLGVGLDAIDLVAAKAAGVTVGYTPDVLTACVADAALALMLSVARRTCVADRFVREGRWSSERFPLARKVSGKTCGIVGMGAIGQAIARRATGFDMAIHYHGPRAKPALPYAYHASLHELATISDFLVLSLPGGADTRHLVDRSILEALGADGILINVARGSIVDEAALTDMLASGTLGGAGLDVFEHEPDVGATLRQLDNVVLQPHTGSATHETRAAMAERVLANLDAYFSGRPLPSAV